MRLLPGGGFDYGNTRLRARHATLLGRADYERLADVDLIALSEEIEGNTQVKASADGAQRPTALGRLHQAVRFQAAQALEQMRSFYTGRRARALVDLLLSRYDAHNVVAVLRAVSHPAAGAQSALLPVGWLQGTVAEEALRLHEPAAAVDLLARSTPHRGQARVLRDALGGYERSGDLAMLERTIVAEDVARVVAGIVAAGPRVSTMLRLVRREIDERNLLIALRARAALTAGGPAGAAPGDPLLPGGTLLTRWFDAVIHATVPGTILTVAAERGRWQGALRRWASDGDLPALQRTLERDRLTETIALFRTGDPLGVDVPVAFTAAVQAQAHNLRLLGEAAAGHLIRDAVRRELLWPLERT